MFDRGINSIFPIPLYLEYAEGEEFKKIEEELISASDKTEFSQRKDWNADTHQLSKNPFSSNILTDHNCIATMEFIQRNVIEYVKLSTRSDGNNQYRWSESWITKTLKGQYAAEHHHGYADISGVYYFNTNGEDGNLRFDNIHSQMAGNFILAELPSKQPMPLKNGLLILWPGVLKHGTMTNVTDNERMSLSFNILIGRQGFVVENG
tara:strand:- start:22 stop:642 length:621 start_codon:yes stop_codon:yes gene_type:complete